MQLDQKVVLITGASEGLGAACASAFRRRGARIAVTARNGERLTRVAGTDGLAIPGDLVHAADRRNIVEKTLAHYGQIDVLVNNAGVGLYLPAFDAPMPQVRALFDLNFFAPLDLIQLVVPGMIQRGSGTIVNVGSVAGKVSLPWFTLYSASKSALGALTDGLRMELRSHGVHAMTVCPSYLATDFQKHPLAGSAPPNLLRRRPLFTTPDACASAIVRGVERSSNTVITPWQAHFFVAAARLFPGRTEHSLEKLWRAAS